MRKVTRREVVAGGAALGVGAACGRTEPFEYGEDGDEMNPEKEAFRSTDSNPIFLTSNATLSSNSGVGTNAAGLKNPVGSPMEILEVRWQITPSSPSDVPGGYIGCKLELGKLPLTNGFVPVWLFDRAESLVGEVPESGIAEYVWRLPKPMYVPAGAVLVPTLQHRGLLSDSVGVRVSVSARTVDPKAVPKKIFLPYASSYVSKAFVTGSATSDTDTSKETDLVNPFDVDIEIQRFTNRLSAFFTQNTAISTESGLDSPVFEVRMVGMDGRPIIKNFTEIRQALGNLTRSWDMPANVRFPANSFYTVFARKLANTTGVVTADWIGQIFVGVIGHRTIEFSKIDKRALEADMEGGA